METAKILDVIEALLRASEHPDITAIARYGKDAKPGGQSPSGVKAVHRTGSYAMMWAAVAPHDATPVPLPTEPLRPVLRASRILVLAHHLLDAAKPAEFRAWQLCTSPGVGLPGSISALRLACQDGSTAYLRGTAASGPAGGAGEPTEEPFPDYVIPEGVHSWHLKVPALSAAPA